jgi:hypothetical protein
MEFSFGEVRKDDTDKIERFIQNIQQVQQEV